MTTETMTGPSTEEFVGRLFDAGLKTMELAMVYLGDKLGLYQTLSESGAVTSGELARKTGMNERYLREWLEQQAVADVLVVDDVSLPADKRRFSLPPEYAEALTKPESPFSIAPLARFIELMPMAAQVVEAFKTGAGIPWSAYGFGVVTIQGEFNRPWLVGQLGTDYLPAIPNVHDRLQKPGARFLDVACGVGWASIATARAYPGTTVLGIDMDPPSIVEATKNATESGLSDRVKFEARDAASLAAGEPFDAAIIVEAVHDMSNPVAVLSAVRKALAPGASLVVVDENVAETFTAPGNEIDRFMYTASVMLCLPNGMSEQPTAATGTVMRPATFESYARAAGFTEVNILPLEHPMFRFYELR